MKKIPVTRLLALLCALVLLACTVVSCADNPTPTPEATEQTTAGAGSEQAPEPETDNRYDEKGYLKDQIPESLRFDGHVIRELTWSDNSSPEYNITESSGDMVKDSVFYRNMHVEDRLGIRFEENGIPGNNGNRNDFLKHAVNAASSGESYDLYAGYSMATALIAYNGLCRNLLDYEVFNPQNPWWPSSLIDEATINNKLYFASGDINTGMLYQMYCVFFNKHMVKDYNLMSPYDCIKDNTWTYEKLFEMGAVVGSAKTALDVIHGVSFVSTVYVDPFFFAAGLRTTETDDTGAIVLSESFYNETAQTVASVMWDYLHQDSSYIGDSKAAAFASGSSLFEVGTINFAPNYFMDAPFEYGVAPIPKYSAEQQQYKSCIGFAYTLYGLPTTATNPEASAAVIECMGSEGYRTITPALFEVTMKARYASDLEATASFDTIRETASFDVGRIFTSSLENMTYNIFRGNITATAKADYGTAFKAKKKQLQKYLDDMNKRFAEIAAAS